MLCRFTLNSEVNLKAALLNMGLGDMFNLATADFTRITSKSPTYQGDEQKCFHSDCPRSFLLPYHMISNCMTNLCVSLPSS